MNENSGLIKETAGLGIWLRSGMLAQLVQGPGFHPQYHKIKNKFKKRPQRGLLLLPSGETTARRYLFINQEEGLHQTLHWPAP
jgi:hypothetical protein